MRELIQPFADQYDNFLSDLDKTKRKIIFGTLGPKGTTSDYALDYLCSYLKKVKPGFEIEVKFQNKFEYVFSDLKNKAIDYAFIPSAYQRITDYYWYPEFTNVLNILYPSPPYGLISKEKFDYSKVNGNIRIAACSAVENMLFYLDKNYFDKYEKVAVSSTVETVKFVLEGKADIDEVTEECFGRYEQKLKELIEEIKGGG